MMLLQQRLSAEEDKRLAEIQKQIVETTNRNRASFRLTDTVHVVRIYDPAAAGDLKVLIIKFFLFL